MNKQDFEADGLAGHDLTAEQLTQVQGGQSIVWGPIVPGRIFPWTPAPPKHSFWDKVWADVRNAVQAVS